MSKHCRLTFRRTEECAESFSTFSHLTTRCERRRSRGTNFVVADACMGIHAALRDLTIRACCVSRGFKDLRVRIGEYGCTGATKRAQTRCLCLRTPRTGFSSTSVPEDSMSVRVVLNAHLLIAPCDGIALRERSTQSGRGQDACTKAASRRRKSRHPGPCTTQQLGYVS